MMAAPEHSPLTSTPSSQDIERAIIAAFSVHFARNPQ